MNPIVKELGYSKDDRVVLVHADDVGLNLSTIEAFAELTDLGTISTGSAMVPTSWFPEVVKQAGENPEWDLGLHLAFNGECETYKWRPISTSDTASGFVDEITKDIDYQLDYYPLLKEKDIDGIIALDKKIVCKGKIMKVFKYFLNKLL